MTLDSKLITGIRIIAGCGLMLFGLLGVGVGIIAMIDPVGTKMADDSDPFGVPPSFIESLGITILFAAMLLLGVWLVAGKLKRSGLS